MKMSSMVGVCSAMALCLAVGTAQAGPNVAKVGSAKAAKVTKKAPKINTIDRNRSTQVAGEAVSPVRVAPVKMVAGKPVVGEWQAYTGVGNDATWVPAFDCYQGDDTGLPIGGPECDIGEGSRWWFGAAYYNPFKTEDMTAAVAYQGANSERVNYGWAWQPVADKSCVILLFTAETFGECVLPDFDGIYDGVAMDFGILPPGNGYYYTDVDLSGSGLFFQLPTGQGAYLFQLGTDVGGEIFLSDEPCQQMLWGTSDAGGLPGRAGTQTDLAWDDDVTVDGVHTEDECYTYFAGVCPDPLGGMMKFWVNDEGGNECYPDCVVDGNLDLFDFLCFVNDFNSNGSYSDCIVDGQHDLFDFLCFVNAFNAGC